MGSTITVGKQAGAFQVDGVTYYALFEKTYESNVFPQTPRWSAYYFGRLEGAIRAIFLNASATEGGMLKGPSERMKPENYIAAWMRALKTPNIIRDGNVEIDFKEVSDISKDVLRREFNLDRDPTLSLLLSLPLYKAAAKLASVCESGRLNPGRIVDRGFLTDETMPGCAPERADTAQIAAAIEQDRRIFYRAGTHGFLRQGDDGLEYVGWAYDAIGTFVNACADREMSMPGYSVQAIPAFRACIAAAEPLPDQTIVRHLPPRQDAPEWEIKQHAYVAARLREDLGIAAGDVIEFDLSTEKARELVDFATGAALSFEMPVLAPEPAAPGMG